MPFELMPLPFAEESFGEIMSAETLRFHHGKHHRNYVDQVNGMLTSQPLTGLSLVELVATARKQNAETRLFNSAAQLWNHNFFWNCLSPDHQRPSGRLASMIDETFGSLDGLLLTLTAEAANHFSNGWVWLVLEDKRLKVVSLHDADTPIVHREMRPLLALDVWEHAYYLDYRNARHSYAEAVLSKIINWRFAAENLDGQGALRADQRFLPFAAPIRRPPRILRPAFDASAEAGS